MIMKAKNFCGANLNDIVRIDVTNTPFFRAVLVLYGLPLVMVIAGFLGGNYVAETFVLPLPELIAFACGIILGGVAFLFIKAIDKVVKKQDFSPVAVEITERRIEKDETDENIEGTNLE